MIRRACFLLIIFISWQGEAFAQSPPSGLPEAARGEWLLLNKPFINADFDQETIDNIWQVWPDALKAKAKLATAEQRRQLAFSRYGLTPRLGDGDKTGKPFQFVVTDRGGWVMNCHSCHSGKVAGQLIPGAPNTLFAMQTLLEETRMLKSKLGKKLTSKEIASVFFPLGGSVGTTNSVMFGVALGAFRDKEMNVVSSPAVPKFVHHDMDAPAWWHFKKKKRLYIDGFAEKNHRILMSFSLIRSNGAKKFRGFEKDFQDIAAYLESLEPPAYPFAIEQPLAAKGKVIFNKNCSRCHGKYGENETYPERTIPIDEIGTDPVRLTALPAKYREAMGKSWQGDYGKLKTIAEPVGYVAPPLDGVWATAPYFHNGSVPTLWHLLHPEQRPTVWQRTEDGYDQQKVGLEVKTFEKIPKGIKNPGERRTYFDTQKFSKKNSGHTFPNNLNKEEKRAVLEYLKTL